MKTAYIIALFISFSMACTAQNAKNYGEKISEDNAISTSAVVKQLYKKDKVETKMEGIINTSCAVKGCWMSMQLPNGEEMRVTFKDYGFFVPTDGLNGKKAIVSGVALKSVTDVETLKHYAEDAGESQEEIAKIKEPKAELTFIADGVLIYD